MALSDKTLTCVECGGEFIFTSGEQEFFNARGFSNEPKRCRSCRAVRRSEQRGSMYSEAPREMYAIVCAECGADAMVPFRPRGDRPVYCSDCFSKTRNGLSAFPSPESTSVESSAPEFVSEESESQESKSEEPESEESESQEFESEEPESQESKSEEPESEDN